MKQRVNLYQAALQPVRQTLTLSRLALGWLLLFLLLCCIAGWLLQRQHSLTQHVASQQQQLSVLQQQIEGFQQAIVQQKPSASLLKQQADLEQTIRQKQQLLQFLAQQQQQSRQFYSPVLQHLVAVDRTDLWLTSFTLHQSYSGFEGIALAANAVPQWLTQLRLLPYFQGQRFRQVDMAQVEGAKAVSFVLVAQQEVKP